MVRLDIVSWRDGAKIIGAIGQKYIDVNMPKTMLQRCPAGRAFLQHRVFLRHRAALRLLISRLLLQRLAV